MSPSGLRSDPFVVGEAPIGAAVPGVPPPSSIHRVEAVMGTMPPPC